MHWSLDFYKADLEGLEMEKNKTKQKAPKVPDYSIRTY